MTERSRHLPQERAATCHRNELPPVTGRTDMNRQRPGTETPNDITSASFQLCRPNCHLHRQIHLKHDSFLCFDLSYSYIIYIIYILCHIHICDIFKYIFIITRTRDTLSESDKITQSTSFNSFPNKYRVGLIGEKDGDTKDLKHIRFIYSQCTHVYYNCIDVS